MHLKQLNTLIRHFLLVSIIFIFILIPTTIHANIPILDNTPSRTEYFITSSPNIELETYIEPLADYRRIMIRPDFTQEVLPIVQSSASGYNIDEYQLGQSSDERKECIGLVNNRRTGICEDGDYQIVTAAVDAAGNESLSTSTNIERDTVKPASPKLLFENKSRLLIKNYNVQLHVEPETKLTINVSTPSGNSSTQIGSYVFFPNSYRFVSPNLISTWEPNTTYKFTARLQDDAQNLSEKLTWHLTTPADVGGGTQDAAIASNSAESDTTLLRLPKIWAYLNLDKNDQLRIERLSVPSAKIINTNTMPDGSVKILGNGIYKNLQGLAILHDENLQHQSLSQLHSLSHTTCWNKHTWIEKRMMELFGKSSNYHKCYRKHRKQHFPPKSNWQTLVRVEITDAGIGLHKLIDSNLKNSHDCFTGRPKLMWHTCPASQLGWVWNDSEDGEWLYQTNLDRVDANQKVFTSGWYKFRFRYNRANYAVDTSCSEKVGCLQNNPKYGSVQLGKPKRIKPKPNHKVTRSPFIYGNWDFAPVITQYPCGSFSHQGQGAYDIDADFRGGVKVPLVATSFGQAKFISSNKGFGQHVVLTNSKYKLIFAHLDPISSRIYQRTNPLEVRPGDKIGYEGNSGYSTGSHLHYELFIAKDGNHYRPASCTEARNILGPTLFKY